MELGEEEAGLKVQVILLGGFDVAPMRLLQDGPVERRAAPLSLTRRDFPN